MKKKIIRAVVGVGSLALIFATVMGGRSLLAAEGQEEETKEYVECSELVIYISEDDFMEPQEKESESENLRERPASAVDGGTYYIGEDEFIIHSEGKDAE